MPLMCLCYIAMNQLLCFEEFLFLGDANYFISDFVLFLFFSSIILMYVENTA